LLHAKQPRAKRFQFVAMVEVTGLDSAIQLRDKTTDLSLFGCQIATVNPWPIGTKVRVRISHNGASFAALGAVARVEPGTMGISFTGIGPKEEALLDKWLADLRDK
jgi:PilZ domain